MKWFKFSEFLKSATGSRMHIDCGATPPAVMANIQALVDNVLDPARERYGKPIYVISGYRCPALNKAVGGSANSQHTKGEAADIHGGIPEATRRIYEVIKAANLPFDQMILEKGTPHRPQWLHVSFTRRRSNRPS